MEYTYLALTEDGTPRAAFHRKYDMEWWLRHLDYRDDLVLWRCRSDHEPVRVDLKYYGL